MIAWCLLTGYLFEDDARLLEGAPCAVQIFTRALHDEECLAFAEIIDDCLRGI